jgi:long-chain fatty acid transport protein
MRALYFSLVMILLPGAAFAGGFAIPNENARELGLSQATTAAQTGPEAAYQNPAALAGQKGLAAAASLELLFNQTTWTDPNLGTATTETHVNTPPSLSVAYGNQLPNGMSYGFGLNFEVPGGGSLYWPYNWPGATRIQQVRQLVFATKLSAGFEPIEGIKIGGCLNYVRITQHLVQKISFLSQLGTGSLGLAGGALTYGAAAEIRVPGIPLTFGADYIHKADMTLTGHAHFDAVPEPFQTVLQDQGASTHVTTPNILYLGAAYRPLDGLTIMAGWDFERWSVYKSDTFVGDKGFTVSVPRNYNNAFVYRLGVEYAHVPFLPPLTLRLGGLRSISEQPTTTLSPTLTDANSWGISIGAGYEIIPEVRVDLGYQHVILDSVTASGTEAFPGTYKTTADFLSFGLVYRAVEL